MESAWFVVIKRKHPHQGMRTTGISERKGGSCCNQLNVEYAQLITILLFLNKENELSIKAANEA